MAEYESKLRSLQQRRRRLEHEKRYITNAVTYPQGIIKNRLNMSPNCVACNNGAGGSNAKSVISQTPLPIRKV